MGDTAFHALTEALLEAATDLKRTNGTVERAALQLSRIANASEDTNALALNEVRDAKLAMERAAAALEKQTQRLTSIETALGIMREDSRGFPLVKPDDERGVGLLKAWGALVRPAQVLLVVLMGVGLLALVVGWLLYTMAKG